VGLDVSSRSISVALIRPASDLIAEERIPNTPEAMGIQYMPVPNNLDGEYVRT